MKKYNLYWTPCVAHCIDLMFEDIGKRESVLDLITNARRSPTSSTIMVSCYLLETIRKVCGGDIVHPEATRFVKNYIALASLLRKRVDLKKIFISDEKVSHKLGQTIVGYEVEGLMFNHAYWDKVFNLVSIYEALYTILRIVDSEIFPTMSFMYALIRVMKQNLHALKAKDWVKKIITDCWDKTLKYSLHAAGN